MTPTAQPPADMDEAAREIARELKHALADNAYPAADGTADIDNDAIDLIAITLRAYAEQCVSAALRQHGASVSAWRPISEAPKDGTDLLLWCGWAITGRWDNKRGEGWHTEDSSNPIFGVTLWQPIIPPDQSEHRQKRETEG